MCPGCLLKFWVEWRRRRGWFVRHDGTHVAPRDGSQYSHKDRKRLDKAQQCQGPPHGDNTNVDRAHGQGRSKPSPDDATCTTRGTTTGLLLYSRFDITQSLTHLN
jgi:hypothetical protein